MLHLRGLQGAGLLHTLSKRLNLTETKVTANGQVQTRLAQKYGSHIREQIQLAPEEENRSEDEVCGSNHGLTNLAEAIKPADWRSARVQEIAPPHSLIRSIRKSLAELRELLSGDCYQPT